jgi:hypothetical protein
MPEWRPDEFTEDDITVFREFLREVAVPPPFEFITNGQPWRTIAEETRNISSRQHGAMMVRRNEWLTSLWLFRARDIETRDNWATKSATRQFYEISVDLSMPDGEREYNHWYPVDLIAQYNTNAMKVVDMDKRFIQEGWQRYGRGWIQGYVKWQYDQTARRWNKTPVNIIPPPHHVISPARRQGPGRDLWTQSMDPHYCRPTET